MKKDWKDFFNGFSLYRTSQIQETYIETIRKYTPKNGTILELACGSGLSSALLADMGYETTCTDIDEDLLTNIREKFSSIKNLKIDFCDMMKADEKYGKAFNSIIHQGVLEHFEDNEIVEILKRQKNVADFIIFDVPNDKRTEKIQEYGNERFLSTEHWKSLIEQAGCTLIQIEGRRFEGSLEKIRYSLSHEERVRYGTSNTFVIKSNEYIPTKLHYGCGTVYLQDWLNVDARCDFFSGDIKASGYLDENKTTKNLYYKHDFEKIIRNQKKVVVDLEDTMEGLSEKFKKHFNELVMYHVLEHIPKYSIDNFMSQMKSITTDNAVFHFAVPDNFEISKLYATTDEEEEREKFHSWIFGKQRDKYCHHFVGFDRNSFKKFLENHFEKIDFVENQNDYPALWVICSNKK